jgi:hypothetical protein
MEHSKTIFLFLPLEVPARTLPMDLPGLLDQQLVQGFKKQERHKEVVFFTLLQTHRHQGGFK